MFKGFGVLSSGLAVRWWQQFGVTCTHDRHKTTKVCVCVFKGFGVLSLGFGCAVVAAVWRDLHPRQAQEYLSVPTALVSVHLQQESAALAAMLQRIYATTTYRHYHRHL